MLLTLIMEEIPMENNTIITKIQIMLQESTEK